ncbi:hypothetical protein E4U22_000321 [Claviceps purpurea]|nr:hypothetical protein E4U22_000321 [Claviceps purpurea]
MPGRHIYPGGKCSNDPHRDVGSNGVLLWGPPGCGKTLIAQAVANDAQASFILVKGPELLNKYVGESERAVRDLFQRARSSKPCIVFFDEMDSIVPPRANVTTESGARVVNALLTELDGGSDRSGVYVIGTTSHPRAHRRGVSPTGTYNQRIVSANWEFALNRFKPVSGTQMRIVGAIWCERGSPALSLYIFWKVFQ